MLFFHLNISFLPFHISDLKTLFSLLDHKMDIIGITESRLTASKPPSTNIELEGYSIEHTKTEAKKGGALLYINSNLNYITRTDLCMYKSKELESVFIEIIHPHSKNIIVGCIYRHPSMCIKEFNNSFLKVLLEKLAKVNKNIILLGDFNINIMNYDCNSDTSAFLNSMCSNSCFPFITQPTRITTKSQTLIDNIFLNFHSPCIISGNLTASISDHLAQFCLIPKTSNREKPIKQLRRSYKNFVTESFVEDIANIDWDSKIKTGDDVNKSMTDFITSYNNILDRHAPKKYVTKKQAKLISKPWITKGILKSIKVKDKLYKKYIVAKDNHNKSEIFNKFKKYRNIVSNLIKYSKREYYTSFFNKNINDIKNTWKGIKQIINISSQKTNKPSSLLINNNICTDNLSIANHFNDFFSTIANKLESKIIPTQSCFSDYLTAPNPNSIFLNPVSENEINQCILNLNLGKSTGPNSIPTLMLKHTSKIISKPLMTVINNSLLSGVFPDMFKIAQVIPIFKKGSKLESSNYRPISLLSNLSRIFERIIAHKTLQFPR